MTTTSRPHLPARPRREGLFTRLARWYHGDEEMAVRKARRSNQPHDGWLS